MLTQRHLAIIRAALQFFDEELVPSGMQTIRHYLDVPLNEAVTHDEVRRMRSFLKNTELKYGRFDRRTKQLIWREIDGLITGSHRSTPAEPGIAVVVLIPTRK